MSSITFYCGIAHLLIIFSCVLVSEGGLLDFLDLGPHNNDGDDAMDDGDSSQHRAVIEFPSLNEMSSTERHANRQRARKVATIIEKNIHMLANDLLQMWAISKTEKDDSDDLDLEAFAKKGGKSKKTEPPDTTGLGNDSTEAAGDTKSKDKILNPSEDSGGGSNKEDTKTNHKLGTKSINEDEAENIVEINSESTEETKGEMIGGDSEVKTKEKNSKLVHDPGAESTTKTDFEKEGNTTQGMEHVDTEDTGATAGNEEKSTKESGEKLKNEKEEKSAEEIESISSEEGNNKEMKEEEPKRENKEDQKKTKYDVSTDRSYTPSRDDLILMPKIENLKATENVAVKTPNEIESGLVKEVETILSNGKGTEISIKTVDKDIGTVKEENDNVKETRTEINKEAQGKVDEDIEAASSKEEGTKTTEKLEKGFEVGNEGDTTEKITATPSKKGETPTTEGLGADLTKVTASKPTEVGAESIRENEEVTTNSLGSEAKVGLRKETISADKSEKESRSSEANLNDGTRVKATEEHGVMGTRHEQVTDMLNASNKAHEEQLPIEGRVNSITRAETKSVKKDNDEMERLGATFTSKTSNFNQSKVRALHVGRKLSKKRRDLFRKRAEKKKWIKKRKHTKPKRKPRRGKYVKSKRAHDRIH